MASVGLSYAPPAEETKYASRDSFRGGAPTTLVLDPPIDELVLFGGGVPNVNNEPGGGFHGFHKSWTPHTHAEKPRSDVSLVPRRFLPAGTKQMLAHEVRLETIRVAERAMHGPGTPPGKEKKEAKKGEVVSANNYASRRRLATAMGGFKADQVAAFDPTAMAGFKADQIGAMDATAMGGFKADQVAAFDPTAMAGGPGPESQAALAKLMDLRKFYDTIE